MTMHAFHARLTTIDPADTEGARWRRLSAAGRRPWSHAVAVWFNWY